MTVLLSKETADKVNHYINTMLASSNIVTDLYIVKCRNACNSKLIFTGSHSSYNH